MQKAAQYLVGEHDFRSFACTVEPDQNTVRTLDTCHVHLSDPDTLIIDVKGNGFLHHMVRNLAGVLVAIGSGTRAPDWAAEVLVARDRTVAGVTAPPQGLCFHGVTYPARYGLQEWSSRVSADDRL